MFLSSSYPEINKSPYSDKSPEGIRPQSSLIEHDDEGHYEGDRSDSSDLEKSINLLTSSLPDLGTPLSSNRKKKKKKIRLSENEVKRQSSLTLLAGFNYQEFKRPDSALPPLKTHCDLIHAIGRRRGIAGSSKASSYLDVTLFFLFYFTDTFDDWLLDEGRSKGFPTPKGKEVRSILRKEIIYSLRTSYFCPAEKVEKLHKLLFGSTEQMFVEKEIRSFLKYFLESVLNVTEPIHFTTGISKYILTFISSINPDRLTVQQLFETSMKCTGINEELKFLSVPYPVLILSVKNPIGIPHSALIPNIQLDISNFIIHLADDTDDSFEFECAKSNSPRSKSKQVPTESRICGYFKSFCRVIYEYMQNLVTQFPGLFSSPTTLDDSWATNSLSSYLISPEGRKFGDSCEEEEEDTLESGSTLLLSIEEDRNNKKKNNRPAKVLLDLMAVVCLSKENNYTAFVRCGDNPRRGWAPWVFFDPLDQGSPVVRKVEDCGKWLSRLEKNPSRIKSMVKIIPQDIQRLLTESTLFVYNTKPNYESQTTILSFANETQ